MPGLLERVIANLVQNALRYSPPGAPVRLAASSYGDPAQTVELRVIDRGPGIPEAEREQAFAPFQRATTAPRRQSRRRPRARHRARVY